jgi:hypothetical protein
MQVMHVLSYKQESLLWLEYGHLAVVTASYT